jgi:hypothetical protein
VEEFIELPSDGRIINKRFIFDFDPARQNRLNYSNGKWVLLKDPRDVKAVTEGLIPRAQRELEQISKKAEGRPPRRPVGRPRKNKGSTKDP